jgi:hypothetical protein
MGAGKILTIIGGISGLLCTILFHVFPGVFCLWRLDVSGFANHKVWIGGFGFRSGEESGSFIDPEYTERILFLLIGTLIAAGGAIAIVGGIMENKIISLTGGISMLVGIGGFIIGLIFEFGDFKELADQIALFGGEGLLFGKSSIPFPSITGEWSLAAGAYMSVGAGAAGLVGGILLESEDIPHTN